MSLLARPLYKSSFIQTDFPRNCSTPSDYAHKSPIGSPALAKDLILNWAVPILPNANSEDSPLIIIPRNRARSFQNMQAQQAKSGKPNNVLQSHTHLTRPPKRIGSIIIENETNERLEFGLMKKQSAESFSSGLYCKIEEFLDAEGLDIIQTESRMDGFKQIIKIEVGEQEEEGEEGEGNELSEIEEQVTIVRIMSSSLIMAPTSASSTLQKRRAGLGLGLEVKRANSENTHSLLKDINSLKDEDGQGDYEDHKEIKSALIKKSNFQKEAMKLLSCIESCEEQSETPFKRSLAGNRMEFSPTTGNSSRTHSLFQGLEKLLPKSGMRATFCFMKEETTPNNNDNNKEGYFSPQTKLRRIANVKGKKPMSSCRELFKRK